MMNILVINISQSALTGLWITLGIVLLFIGYRLLLRRLKRGIPDYSSFVLLHPLEMNPGIPDYSSFVLLHPLEMNPASGELEFYFTMEKGQEVQFTVKSEDNSFDQTLLNTNLTSGPHIVRFDSTQVPNGRYTYEIKTDQQQTMKFFDIIN